MKIAIFSDIHGNYIALEAFVEILKSKKVDKLICLGDSIGYYPESEKVLSKLKNMEVYSLLGNHEYYLLNRKKINAEKVRVYNFENNWKSISESNVDFIKNMPVSITLDVDGLELLFVHGSYNDSTFGYLYKDKIDEQQVSEQNFSICFCGHTHHSYVKQFDEKIIVNVGSIGLPRDIGNQGSFVVYDTNQKTINLERFKINVSKIKTKYLGKVHYSVISVLSRNNKSKLNSLKVQL
tara:strand:+ start:705 stop:1415 length:711 start_codon:yes stop_codon:yes gene_type:complete